MTGSARDLKSIKSVATAVEPSSDLLVKTEQLLYFRLAFASVGLLFCLALWLFGPDYVDVHSVAGTVASVLGYSALALVVVLTRNVGRKPQLYFINHFLIALDVMALTALVHCTRGLESDLYVLYILPILLSSYTGGRKGTYLTAALVSVFYVGLLVVENADSLPYLVSGEGVTLTQAYTGRLWGKIVGRSILLVSVSFIWARFCSYMSGLATQGANKLREQLENNNLMVAEIQAQAQREQLINSINSALRSTLELDRILETAADELASALNVFRCAIVCRMSESDDDTFVCEAEPGDAPDREIGTLRYFDVEICEFLLRTKSRYEVLDDGNIVKTFVFSSPAEDKLFAPVRERIEKAGYGSLVVQPMIYGESSKGVIIIGEIDPRRQWTPSEVELIKSVAGQVAVAIEQAALINELSRKNQDLTQKNLNLDAKNNELRAVQSQLIHQEKMASLGRLVAGIAHELNNPINFVHGNLPYLKEYVEDLKTLVASFEKEVEDRRELLDALKDKMRYDFLVTDLDNIIADLKEGADRIRHIIKNLRSFSRLDEAELKEASVKEGLESTLKILSQYYGRDKIPVETEFEDIPPVLCYPGQLNQVWMNLLSNAAQAVEERDGGKVEIKVRKEGGEVVVSISDNGPGIKPEIQSKIFDPFFTTKPVGQGTGLGLSICHSIVERHGGQIALESVLEEGTTFTIRIPLEAIARSGSRESETPAPETGAGREGADATVERAKNTSSLF